MLIKILWSHLLCRCLLEIKKKIFFLPFWSFPIRYVKSEKKHTWKLYEHRKWHSNKAAVGGLVCGIAGYGSFTKAQ